MGEREETNAWRCAGLRPASGGREGSRIQAADNIDALFVSGILRDHCRAKARHRHAALSRSPSSCLLFFVTFVSSCPSCTPEGEAVSAFGRQCVLATTYRARLLQLVDPHIHPILHPCAN
jgi:hypothetical protein